MIKSYYLKYGYTGENSDIVKYLEDNYFFDFILHESLYFGVYFSYSGFYADKLTIGNNFVSGEYIDSINSQYETLVNVQITEGKNKDKVGKYKFIKEILSEIQGLDLIKDKLRED